MDSIKEWERLHINGNKPKKDDKVAKGIQRMV